MGKKAPMRGFAPKSSHPNSKQIDWQYRGTDFCITDHDAAREPRFPADAGATYMVFKLERGEMSDHNHWQIFVQFKSLKVAWNVVKLLGCSEKVHVSARYGAATEAAAYCLKPDVQLNSTPVEHGALAQGRGAGAGFRSDIKKLKERIRDSKDWKGVLNDAELALTSKNHMRFVKEVWRTRPVPRIVNATLRPWQQELIDLLKTQPHPDAIEWWADAQEEDGAYGMTGKGWVGRWIRHNLRHSFVFSSNEIASDLYSRVPESARIIVAVQDGTVPPFDLLRGLKKGVYSSGKHDGVEVTRRHQAHVVVLAREAPPALTGRRITIRQRAIPYQAEYDGESGGDLEEGAPLSDSEATEIGSDAGE